MAEVDKKNGGEPFNNQSVIDKHSINLQPELQTLLKELRKNEGFKKKYPDFTLTSSFRPVGKETDLGFDTQWGLWNNWEKWEWLQSSES